MIGDLVKIGPCDKYVGATAEVECIQSANEDGSYQRVFILDRGRVLHEVHSDDIEPIPLSDSLLIDNGWQVSHDAAEKKDTYMHPRFPLMLTQDKGQWWLVSYDTAAELMYILKVDHLHQLQHLGCTTGGHRINNIEHVHQLQHALHICGLKKKITL